MGKTKIEWADYTMNPWVGCTKVSPACDHCYAEGWAKRTGHPELWGGERRRTSAANWQGPIKWNRKAEAEGRRIRVFCASLADVFDNQVPERWRDDLWHRIDQTPHLDWLLLTKRPQNITKMLPGPKIGAPEWGEGWPNVWLGTTAENQEEADRRIPQLLATPAAVRFVSLEPLLGPIDLVSWLVHQYPELNCIVCGRRRGACHHAPKKLDWVICGGESGPKARPMHPDWARSLRDQCAGAGVAFHFKQWGEWAPDGVNFVSHTVERMGSITTLASPGYAVAWRRQSEPLGSISEGDQLHRAGKKAAGRLLDGVAHNGMPA